MVSFVVLFLMPLYCFISIFLFSIVVSVFSYFYCIDLFIL